LDFGGIVVASTSGAVKSSTVLFPLPPDCSDGGPLQYSTSDLAFAMLYSVGKGNVIVVGHSGITGN